MSYTYKWPCSIAILNYQRVSALKSINNHVDFSKKLPWFFSTQHLQQPEYRWVLMKASEWGDEHHLPLCLLLALAPFVEW